MASNGPPHPYTRYNSICISLGVMNLVSLPTFWGQGIHWSYSEGGKSSR